MQTKRLLVLWTTSCFIVRKKSSQWVTDSTIQEKTQKRLLKSLDHLSNFLKDGGAIADKKVAIFIYLTHLIFVSEKRLSDEGRHKRYKLIKKYRKKVEANLLKSQATNYYLRPLLAQHIKTTTEILAEEET
ncbi:hypothetical protein GMAR_ORF77 [Golden Marseillevirus]|uniref:hypothetical protein n=1 Tax=Golden Marseillevirus TaxID=1720526 RepID=UPI000877ACFA|nr:hypothetical protein GMAR_ORF77 [Golden Marseillevirus]ALX27452.1 hypothetical protein GMAR_ORF77 [Golden Marseillevirus]